jgi:hypothetical protein
MILDNYIILKYLVVPEKCHRTKICLKYNVRNTGSMHLIIFKSYIYSKHQYIRKLLRRLPDAL